MIGFICQFANGGNMRLIEGFWTPEDAVEEFLAREGESVNLPDDNEVIVYKVESKATFKTSMKLEVKKVDYVLRRTE